MKTEIRKWYHDNGNIRYEIPFVNGIKYGIQKNYDYYNLCSGPFYWINDSSFGIDVYIKTLSINYNNLNYNVVYILKLKKWNSYS